MSVAYKLSGGIAHITMDDGKVNAFSSELFHELNQALDQSEADQAIPVLAGRDGIFSAGYDLGELSSNPASTRILLQLGARLCCRLLDFPYPVITACNGHAYPMGAFVLMCSDYRVGSNGPFRIGMNEVRINITVPRFAIEVARGRLHPAWFNRTVVNGEMFSPSESLQAGFLDEVAAASDLLAVAEAKADEFDAIEWVHHRATKRRVRSALIAAIEKGIEEDLKEA
jgi:enoyl-CoA hydratase